MRQKPILLLFSIVLISALAAGGIWLYEQVLGNTLEASQPIQAVPLVIGTPPPQGPNTEEPNPTAIESESPTTAAPADKTQTPVQTLEQQTSLTVYEIVQDESEARFLIYEELNGNPTTVAGRTNQVAGEAVADLNDLKTVRLGVIQVNARTLVTDEDRRNQAIRNRILNTDQFEYITFTPSEINGLSGIAAPGDRLSFTVAGDLEIRSVTNPVVFEVIVEIESTERISGSANTTIQRRDFNLAIPNVPFVANVAEDITLEIDFILAPVLP